MPLVSAEVRNPGIQSLLYPQIATDKGRLKAVTIINTTHAALQRPTWASISLHTGSSSLETIGAQLASGVFTEGSPLAWDGDLPLRNDYIVSAIIWGEGTETYRLTILYELD